MYVCMYVCMYVYIYMSANKQRNNYTTAYAIDFRDWRLAFEGPGLWVQMLMRSIVPSPVRSSRGWSLGIQGGRAGGGGSLGVQGLAFIGFQVYGSLFNLAFRTYGADLLEEIQTP